MTRWQGEIPEQCELSDVLPKFHSYRSKADEFRRLLTIVNNGIVAATGRGWVKKMAEAK